MTSVALVLWSRLDFSRIDLNNWVATISFYGCLLTAVLSFFANISSFLDHAFGPVEGLERAIRRLKRRGYSSLFLVWAMLMLTWRRKPMIALEVVVAMVIVYAALQGGVISAISAATAALRNGIR
jgi:hypothetical protein